MTEYPKRVKAIRWHGVEDLRLDTIELPEMEDDQILVKNMYGGICATDRHVWHHGTLAVPPAILGHEGSSEILKIGKNVKHDLVGDPIEEGDMVIYQDILGCGECIFCRAGASNVCPRSLAAAQKPGVLVQYYSYPSRQFVKVEGITPRQGALVEPASVALHGARLARIDSGDTVLIIGAGPIGLFRVQHARNLGAGKILVSEIVERKRRIARDLGADIVMNPKEEDVVQRVRDETDGDGADVVFEDVGKPELQSMAIDAVRPHGIVILCGITTEPITINFTDKVILREITVQGSVAYSTWSDKPHDHKVVANLIKKGRLKIDPIVSHEFTIDQWKDGFEVSDDPLRSVKVIFKLT